MLPETALGSWGHAGPESGNCLPDLDADHACFDSSGTEKHERRVPVLCWDERRRPGNSFHNYFFHFAEAN